MKRVSRRITTLALLMSLGAVAGADAGSLAKFSPNPARLNGVSIGGIPAWYQDANGIAIPPCLDVATCAVIPPGPGALSFPANFPEEGFYFLANADIPMTDGGDALIVAALEFAFVDVVGNLVPASTPGAVGTVFQRQRIVHTLIGGGGAGPTAGNWVLTTPWGTTTFPASAMRCVNSGGNTKCSGTIDQPAGAVDYAAALGVDIAPTPGTIGINSIGAFLRSVPPTPGLLGNGGGAAAFTDTAGVTGSFSLTAPALPPAVGTVTGSTGILVTLVGHILGLDIQPSANLFVGKADIGATTPPPFQTVTITNTTGNPIDFTGTFLLAGADAGDFALAPPTQPATPPALANCIGLTNLAVGAVCGLDVTFTPAAAARAARAATLAVAPVNNPVVAGVDNPPAVTMNLTGTAQFPVALTVSGGAVGALGDGTITSTPAGINCSVAGGVQSGTCTASFDVGSAPVLSATPTTTPLSLFDAWTGPCAVDPANANNCTLTMAGPLTQTGAFIQAFNVKTATVTTPATATGGTITAPQVVKSGGGATLTISPNACFHILSVTDAPGPLQPVTPVAGTTTSSYALTGVVADHTVTATFSNALAMTKTAGANGAINGPATATCNDNLQFSVAPDAKFQVRSILVNGKQLGFVPAATPAGAIPVPVAAVQNDQIIEATFMPSGDINGDGVIDVADALQAMRMLLNIAPVTATDAVALDVAPLGVDNKPKGDGAQDISDVVLVLKKAVGVINW